MGLHERSIQIDKIYANNKFSLRVGDNPNSALYNLEYRIGYYNDDDGYTTRIKVNFVPNGENINLIDLEQDRFITINDDNLMSIGVLGNNNNNSANFKLFSVVTYT